MVAVSAFSFGASAAFAGPVEWTFAGAASWDGLGLPGDVDGWFWGYEGDGFHEAASSAAAGCLLFFTFLPLSRAHVTHTRHGSLFW